MEDVQPRVAALHTSPRIAFLNNFFLHSLYTGMDHVKEVKNKRWEQKKKKKKEKLMLDIALGDNKDHY